MRKLAVAESACTVDPTFERAYTEGQPGFQIGPGVSTADCLAILQNHMRIRLGMSDFAFNVSFGTMPPDDIEGIHHTYITEATSDIKAHMDEIEASRKLGIVLHHNRRRIGRVVLQLAKPDVTELPQGAWGCSVVRQEDMAGPEFEGELCPDMKTIFYEGFAASNGLVGVTLGATVHDFQSTGPYREWTRYGWEPVAA